MNPADTPPPDEQARSARAAGVRIGAVAAGVASRAGAAGSRAGSLASRTAARAARRLEESAGGIPEVSRPTGAVASGDAEGGAPSSPAPWRRPSPRGRTCGTQRARCWGPPPCAPVSARAAGSVGPPETVCASGLPELDVDELVHVHGRRLPGLMAYAFVRRKDDRMHSILDVGSAAGSLHRVTVSERAELWLTDRANVVPGIVEGVADFIGEMSS